MDFARIGELTPNNVRVLAQAIILEPHRRILRLVVGDDATDWWASHTCTN